MKDIVEGNRGHLSFQLTPSGRCDLSEARRSASTAMPYDAAAMPEEMEVLTGLARVAAAIAIALIVASGVFLRFFTHSALWLDEALTVDRSSLPVARHRCARSSRMARHRSTTTSSTTGWSCSGSPISPLARFPESSEWPPFPWRGWRPTALVAAPPRGSLWSSWPVRHSRFTTPPRRACTPSRSCSLAVVTSL